LRGGNCGEQIFSRENPYVHSETPLSRE